MTEHPGPKGEIAMVGFGLSALFLTAGGATWLWVLTLVLTFGLLALVHFQDSR